MPRARPGWSSPPQLGRKPIDSLRWRMTVFSSASTCDDLDGRMVIAQAPERLDLHSAGKALAAVRRHGARVVGEAKGRTARDASSVNAPITPSSRIATVTRISRLRRRSDSSEARTLRCPGRVLHLLWGRRVVHRGARRHERLQMLLRNPTEPGDDRPTRGRQRRRQLGGARVEQGANDPLVSMKPKRAANAAPAGVEWCACSACTPASRARATTAPSSDRQCRSVARADGRARA